MATYPDLLDAIARVRSVTGDPEAWKKGLTGDDVVTVCNPASPPAALGAVLAKVTAAHPEVFLAPSPAAPPPRIGEGAAADAIRDAEAALAHQTTDAAHVDLQVVTAVLNAHAAREEGVAELIALQRDIEAAVVSRTDLDTPAGAREFQRFLIAKLRDIRDVVDTAGLDATSKASLAAALATLYASSTPDPRDRGPVEDRDQVPSELPAGHRGAAEIPSGAMLSAQEPLVVGPDPGYPPAADPVPLEPAWSDPPLPAPVAETTPAPPPPPAATPAPIPPQPASVAPPWSGALPAGSPFGGALPTPAGAPPPQSALPQLPTPELPRGTRGDSPRDTAADPADPPPEDAGDNPGDGAQDAVAGTIVDLPDGDTITAPTPQLAAAIAAAVGGTPIPDAFRLQGITLPAPGSPVAAPLDPARLGPGDIGLFTDRHALALGNGKALLDQRIQPIASVSGPGFLGWQHPPAPDTAEATPDAPAPNRVAATAPS